MGAEFNVEKAVAYWRKGAVYDLGVANALLRARKYPYALFMGHLALEKLLKGLVVRNTRSHAPLIHRLQVLAQRAKILVPPAIETKLMEFMEFHFEARYPRQEMEFYAKCTKKYAAVKMKEIREVYKWLRNQLDG